MATIVRKCTRCGNRDLQNHWDSMDEALGAGALRMAWTCPNCAWTEADLVEVDQSELDRELVHADKREERR